MARAFDLSIALFAHGWTYEKADDWNQFIDNESRSASSFLSFTHCTHFLVFLNEFISHICGYEDSRIAE